MWENKYFPIAFLLYLQRRKCSTFRSGVCSSQMPSPSKPLIHVHSCRKASKRKNESPCFWFDFCRESGMVSYSVTCHLGPFTICKQGGGRVQTKGRDSERSASNLWIHSLSYSCIHWTQVNCTVQEPAAFGGYILN